MLVALEVRAFQKPVTSQNGIVAARGSKKRCIIPDTQSDGASSKVLRGVCRAREDALQNGILALAFKPHLALRTLQGSFVRQYSSLARLGRSVLSVRIR
jgi:hypothetical protein